MKRDPRIDAYIEKSADFAKPILKHLRAVVHSACPQVEETMKWSMPHFDYKGAMMCSMAAFKQHCSFGFWRGALIVKDNDNKDTEAMGQFGRIASLKDLPAKRTIAAYIKIAMKLNDSGVKSPMREKRQPRKALPMPKDFAAAIKRDKRSQATFDAFSPSNKRDYIEWITDAKTDETRERRIETAVEWLAEGKARHWKYQKKKK
jgi:uncharacterized protein YdeI (YjbR/CyaY-like superfamily)